MERPRSHIGFQNAMDRLQTVEEKINYCAQIIYETHNYLRENDAELPSNLRNRAMGIIRSAETQLFKLIKK